MKYLRSITLFSFLALIIGAGCNKNTSQSPAKSLSISKTAIAKGEAIVVTNPDSSSKIPVAVSVLPAGFNTIAVVGNKAILTFSKSGTYLLRSALAQTASYQSVTVADSTLKAVNIPNPLSGDQLTLTPALKSTDSSGLHLTFMVTTRNSYPCNNGTICGQYACTAQSFGYQFGSVLLPTSATCTGINGPVNTLIDLGSITTEAKAKGSYPLTLTLNSVTYTGSILFTATGLTITWSYTSGIIISAKQVNF